MAELTYKNAKKTNFKIYFLLFTISYFWTNEASANEY